VGLVFRNQPNAGIPHACTENFLRGYDRDSTSRLTRNRVPGDRSVHFAQHLRARFQVTHERGIPSNELDSHARRLSTTAESASTIGHAQHHSLIAANNQATILVLRISGRCQKNGLHQIWIGSRAFNHSDGMLSRPALKATMPQTIAAFVSQSPPALMVLPSTSTKLSR